MKTVLLAATCAIVMALASNAVACDKPKKDKAAAQKSPRAEAGEKGSTYLTGSAIKQNVQRHGRITAGANNVQVLEKKDIDRSGQSNLRDFLNQQGVTH